MAENKTRPTDVPVEDFLATVPPRRADQARTLLPLYTAVSGAPPVMWGPSIIGFGAREYEVSGRTEQMPLLSFSPRKAQLTLYFSEGFDHHGDALVRLGASRHSRSCLYLTRFGEADLGVVEGMLRESVRLARERPHRAEAVEDYLRTVPEAARAPLDALRALVRAEAPDTDERLSYGIIGYQPAGERRCHVFVSGWKDHVGLYPVPHDETLEQELAPYRRGKGTLWFPLDEQLPEDLVRRAVRCLMDAS